MSLVTLFRHLHTHNRHNHICRTRSIEIYKKKYGKKTPLITTPWFKSGTNKDVNIMFSFGATEAKPPEEADAIFDVIETGSTLAQNNLKVTDVIMESSACLIANKKALKDPKKRQKIYDVVTLF